MPWNKETKLNLDIDPSLCHFVKYVIIQVQYPLCLSDIVLCAFYFLNNKFISSVRFGDIENLKRNLMMDLPLY